MTRVLISAGEASGDIHAGAITAALKEINKDIEVYGMGGDLLRAAGGEVLFDIKDHSVMGFVEVLKKLPDIFKLKAEFKKLLQERRPDIFVTIDYPDFNMRIAKIAHEMGIPVLSFIPPSAWVWRKGRAKDVAKITDKVACIFPFEYDVYKEAGAKAEFVGHPLVDIVKPSMSKAEAEKWAGKEKDKKLILLMPGSRLMEIEKALPTLLEAGKLIKNQLPNVQFILPRAGTIPMELLTDKVKASRLDVKITEGNNYDLFSVADLALATSGTVTLEAALCDLGSIIVYKASPITFFIAKLVVKIPNIGLPNIVAGKQILPELLQDDFTPEKVAQKALEFLTPERNAQMHEDLKFVRERLGGSGAVKRVAQLIIKTAEDKK
ncbi:MAG: lipid-A-disaccharide synthase [Phascolarctobacterium sp.]|nr:lipid-A-disaccharide synthase [Phascolarctobacterium sp.]